MSALELIKRFEGYRLKAYQDSIGIWTIGYGTTRINKEPVIKGLEITPEEAEEYLQGDLELIKEKVESFITVNISENQLDSILSLVYNIGINAFRKSTLLKLLNNKHFTAAAAEFLRWNKAGGKVIPGLVNRRNAEKAHFEGIQD